MTTTNILLALIASLLLVGFAFVLNVLWDIRDFLCLPAEDSSSTTLRGRAKHKNKMSETNGHVERLTDEIVDEEDYAALKAASDYWSKLAGNPPFGTGYGSGKGQPPPERKQ